MGTTLNTVFGALGETATIIVTAPTGGIVTLTTPSGIVLTTLEVSGTWTFSGLDRYGTYVATAVSGGVTKTVNVLVDSAETYRVDIAFTIYLYNAGDECADITGGWISDVIFWSNPYLVTIKEDTDLRIYKTTGDAAAGNNYMKRGFATVDKVDLTNYQRLSWKFAADSVAAGYGCYIVVAITSSLDGATNALELPSSVETWSQGNAISADTVFSIDISNIIGEYYVVYYGAVMSMINWHGDYKLSYFLLS